MGRATSAKNVGSKSHGGTNSNRGTSGQKARSGGQKPHEQKSAGSRAAAARPEHGRDADAAQSGGPAFGPHGGAGMEDWEPGRS